MAYKQYSLDVVTDSRLDVIAKFCKRWEKIKSSDQVTVWVRSQEDGFTVTLFLHGFTPNTVPCRPPDHSYRPASEFLPKAKVQTN